MVDVVTYLIFVVTMAFLGAAYSIETRVGRRRYQASRTRVSCEHAGAVDVDSSVTGEVLCRWCPDCSTQIRLSTNARRASGGRSF